MDMIKKDNAPSVMKRLLKSYPALLQIMQNIKQVVWVLDLGTGQILYISPAFETVWGRTRESFYQDPLTLIKSVHAEDRVKVLSASPDDNRKSLNQSYRILKPDGSLRWISAQTFLIQDKSAHTSYQVYVAEDISDQNQIDQTLRKALDRSREQFTLSRRMSLARKPEAVLKTLMSASELRTAKRAFVLFFDPPLRGLSAGIEVITSWTNIPYQPNSNLAVSLNEINLFEELALTDLFHPSRSVIVTENPKGHRLTIAARDILVAEQIMTVAIFPMIALGNWLGCLLVLFPEERFFEPVDLRHIKVLVDQATITLYNLKLLEIEAESRHEAERANEIKTEFLAMISHELRTPLTSILGFTTTLLADDVAWDADEQRDFYQTIQQEANRLQELIDQLLVLSRLEAKMLPISLKPYTLHEIIEDALPQFQILTNGQELTIHLRDNLPSVYVDPKRISQVLVNLVRNAAVYAPKGTEISISAYTRGGFVQVNVSDQGPGIPSADHKRVFKAFQRGASVENGTVQGAGLGLAICKGLVEAHGGRIWIKKKNSPGTIVSFTIPLVSNQFPVEPEGEER